MHLPSSLFFVALTCAALICWVNADDQHIDDDVNGQLERESCKLFTHTKCRLLLRSFNCLIVLDDTELTSNDEEDRQFNTFSQQCLQAHNDYRKKHGVAPLVLDQKVK
jgi:hypothetical protein